ncbi:MAG: DUF6273 domain-containing protein [Acutalibacteraceae bacterium]|nr:DUF6273 domain-containing protein [Acutalibacteraceae bacterium]
MKKLLAMLLSTVTLLSLAACGGGEGDTKTESMNNSHAGTSVYYGPGGNGNATISVEENLKDFKCITFGTYEQDNDTSNGAEDIEWLVLDEQDGKTLVISKHALDAKAFREDQSFSSWANSTLGTWLNADFYNTAFSDSEKSMIITTDVKAEKNPRKDGGSGADTQDKVFLLSIGEVLEYFVSDEKMMCKPTEYAIAQGAEPNKNYDGSCEWWLRTNGDNYGWAAAVYYHGGIDYYGNEVEDSSTAVRPAMWITIG